MRIERVPHQKAAWVRLGAYKFEKRGVPRIDLRDPYHLAVALTWPQFLIALLALYLLVNIAFATLFWIVPGSVANVRPYNPFDNFFFSIETLSTVGYGQMYPASFYGHVIASAEIACGLAFTAILTGLTFVRFSRPRSKIVFAASPVVATHNGRPTLMIRVGNGRAAPLMDATAKLSILLFEKSAEGTLFRRIHELPLQRTHLPVFPLTWTLMHVLNEQSPLHSDNASQAIGAGVLLFLSLEARDPTLATMVHDLRTYGAQEIRFGMQYKDAITLAEDGTPIADLTQISALEPDLKDHQESGWSEREEAME
ncbi:MAG TPA: ion channel [Acetobacteraceae bacterium]|jgi:inward rectifier potassium channel|nr:ion channel [Acetobacteraceae bacterium]